MVFRLETWEENGYRPHDSYSSDSLKDIVISAIFREPISFRLSIYENEELIYRAFNLPLRIEIENRNYLSKWSLSFENINKNDVLDAVVRKDSYQRGRLSVILRAPPEHVKLEWKNGF